MTDRRREFERRVREEIPDPAAIAFFESVAKEAMKEERRVGRVEFGWHFSTGRNIFWAVIDEEQNTDQQ